MQDKNLLQGQNKPNEPTKAGPPFQLLLESPFASVSTVCRGHSSLYSVSSLSGSQCTVQSVQHNIYINMSRRLVCFSLRYSLCLSYHINQLQRSFCKNNGQNRDVVANISRIRIRRIHPIPQAQVHAEEVTVLYSTIKMHIFFPVWGSKHGTTPLLLYRQRKRYSMRHLQRKRYSVRCNLFLQCIFRRTYSVKCTHIHGMEGRSAYCTVCSAPLILVYIEVQYSVLYSVKYTLNLSGGR